MKTLLDILKDVNAVIDLDASAPSGTELETRANYANQAVWDASAVSQFKEFKSEYVTTTSTLATVPLPSNFREFQEWPRIKTESGWQAYEPIDIGQKYDREGDYVCWVVGNPAEGYSAVFQNIIADATLSIIYQRYPTGLLTLTSVCELPDPTYVTRKVESYILYSRSDDRFLAAESKAQQVLANSVGREMKGEGGLGRTTPSNFKNPLA